MVLVLILYSLHLVIPQMIRLESIYFIAMQQRFLMHDTFLHEYWDPQWILKLYTLVVPPVQAQLQPPQLSTPRQMSIYPKTQDNKVFHFSLKHFLNQTNWYLMGQIHKNYKCLMLFSLTCQTSALWQRSKLFLQIFKETFIKPAPLQTGFDVCLTIKNEARDFFLTLNT